VGRVVMDIGSLGNEEDTSDERIAKSVQKIDEDLGNACTCLMTLY